MDCNSSDKDGKIRANVCQLLQEAVRRVYGDQTDNCGPIALTVTQAI